MKFYLFKLVLLFELSFVMLNGAPFNYVKSSEDSECFFIMGVSNEGACYKALDIDNTKLLWRVEGWYSYPEDIFLSYDGRVLVRVLDLNVEDPGLKDQVLLQFYKDGKIKNSFTVKDLLDHNDLKFIENRYDRSLALVRQSGVIGIFGKSKILEYASIDDSSVLPDNNLIANQFFIINTSGEEDIVFDLVKCNICYRGKSVKKITDKVLLPWE